MRTASDPGIPDGAGTPSAPRRIPASPTRTQGLVARLLGLALGVALAAAALADLAVPEGPPALPVEISVSLARSGEVGVVGRGDLLLDAALRPGDDGPARGRGLLASETSVPLDLSVQDVGPPTGLEDHLWLRVTVGRTLVFEGAQARLRRSSSPSLRISPGATVPIDVAVGLLPGAATRVAGRRTDIRLQLLSPAAGGRAGASG